MSTNRRARWGLIAALVAATAFVPSAVQAKAPQFTLSVRDGGVSEAGKVFSLWLRPSTDEPWRLDHTKLVVDTADIAEFATAWVPSYTEDGKTTPAKYCTTEGTRLTCDVGTTYWVGLGLPGLMVQAKKGAEVGRSGRLTVTVTADGLAPLVATPKVTVADDIDLAVSVAKTPVTGERGKPVTVPIQVTNTGTKPVKGAALRIVGFDGLQHSGRYTNCGYDGGVQQVYCRFDEALAPGSTYVLSDPTLAVRADAPATEKSAGYLAMLWTGDDFDEAGIMSGLTRGTAGELDLVKVSPSTASARAMVTDSKGANNLAFGRVQLPRVPSPDRTPPATGSPSGGPAPSAPTAVPSASEPPTAGGGGGELPITGAPAVAMAGAGVGLLVLGLVGLGAAYRRRTRFSA